MAIYYTPIIEGAAADADTINDPLEELDDQIVINVADIDTNTTDIGNIDAANVPFTQGTPGDWTSDPDFVAPALDELAARTNRENTSTTMQNTSGFNLPIGAVVTLDTGASTFTTTVTPSDAGARYVLLEAIDDTESGLVANAGYVIVLTEDAVVVGDVLGANGTPGRVAAGETGVFVALTAIGGGLGTVKAAIN